MSQSIIPLAPPHRLMLTAAGIQEWDSWTHVGDAEVDDLYYVREWEHTSHPEFAQLVSLRTATKLWLRKAQMFAVEQNPATGEWEKCDE